MRGKLLLLNLLLLAGCAAAGWRLRAQYQEHLRRRQEFFKASVPPVPAPALVLPAPPQQISAVTYFPVAAKLPFSKDRNPEVIIEVIAPKPMPDPPRYYGMMNFGAGPRVILASRPGQPQKSYSPGDQIGEFKLVAVEESGLVFDWDGKQVSRGYGDLMDRSAAAQPQTPAAAAPAAPTQASPVATVSSVATKDVNRPGEEATDTVRTCLPGDTSAPGSVVDGYRKVITRTPFGNSCLWQKVQ